MLKLKDLKQEIMSSATDSYSAQDVAPDDLRRAISILCRNNLFLGEPEKKYWLSQIAVAPLSILEPLHHLFSDFDRKFRDLIRKKLSRDPEGRFKRFFENFFRVQKKSLMQNDRSGESKRADTFLEESLNKDF